MKHEEEEEQLRAKHDFSSSTSLSTDVVFAVAVITDTDPRDMPPLSEVVVPDGLDMLFPDPQQSADRRCTLVFTYAGCEVTIQENGEIAVRLLSE